jgi:helix-turn-helix protein
MPEQETAGRQPEWALMSPSTTRSEATSTRCWQFTALPKSSACRPWDARDGSGSCQGGDLDQLVNDSLPPGSFGALLRARRHRACLSQEQLGARAELSERTVRNLEPGRPGGTGC